VVPTGPVPRWQLAFAAAGVLLAATDTYVVVVALPAIMSSVGLGLDHLQRATPVVSGFLLGYIAVLPLLGRLSDLTGTRPVFIGGLIAFATGSVVTATAHGLGILVAGRALQGLGGGALVPVTVSLVAGHWPPERRGLPLGVVGAVQELGSVLGPLYGAAVVALAGWRWIFWCNLPLAAAVGAGYVASTPGRDDGRGRRGLRDHGGPHHGGPDSGGPHHGGPHHGGPHHGGPDSGGGQAGRRRPDVVGLVLAALAGVTLILALDAPAALAHGVHTGRLYAPLASSPGWAPLTTPLAFVAAGLIVAGVAWETLRPDSVTVALRRGTLRRLAREADLAGGVLLAGVLACVVVAFSTTDPGRQVVASSTVVVGPVAAALAAALVWRQRRAAHPLLEPAMLRAPAAWGAIAVNLAVGVALIAALVDVPLFARATSEPRSQAGAALVLLRFLAAVPVGAVLGGGLCRRPRRGPVVAGTGLALSALAFVSMTSWSASALTSRLHLGAAHLPLAASDVELVACGLGFGLAIAPVNAALLAAVPVRRHGLASSLAVVARTVGMLVGISALTAVALHRFYRAEARIGSPFSLCPQHPTACAPYDRATTTALLGELHTIFLGAAGAAAIGAALSLLLLRSPDGADVQR
jgi:MFS family permease